MHKNMKWVLKISAECAIILLLKSVQMHGKGELIDGN